MSKHTPTQEAEYALTFGLDRADLKPEVQAEYDRLVAEAENRDRPTRWLASRSARPPRSGRASLP
jgi:hypothetical protein